MRPILFYLCLQLLSPALIQADNSQEDDVQDKADTPVPFVLADMPGLMGRTVPGPYNTIFNLLIAGVPVPVSTQFLPTQRTLNHFLSGKAACIFPGSAVYDFASASEKPTRIIASDTLLTTYLRVYVPLETPPPTSIADLQTMALASEQGSQQSVNDLMVGDKTLSVLQVSSLHQAFQLLRSGRVDGVIAFDFDVQNYARGHDVAWIHHAADFALSESKDAVLCSDGPKARAIIAHVNDRLAAMRASGRLDDILRAVRQ